MLKSYLAFDSWYLIIVQMLFSQESLKLVVFGLFVLLISCNLLKEKDRIPPVVEIVSPEDSMWFSGQLKIIVNAYDSVGVESVVVYGDNNWLGTDTAEPYFFTWQFEENQNFSWHSLYAKAYDKAENEGTSPTRSVYYIGRGAISLYHGIATVNRNDDFSVKFTTNPNDSLLGETIVNNYDSLAHFYLLDDTNFDSYKNNEPFSAILEFHNFTQFSTSYHFADQGNFYLVWGNTSSRPKSIWIRFYLTRP